LTTDTVASRHVRPALSAAAFLLVLAWSAHPAWAQQEKAGHPLGKLDDFTGMYRQTIPVVVPPYHGLEPRLSLEYNSASGNGFVGVGWEVNGFSFIQEPWGSNPKYYQLDGEPMIPCATGSLSPSCTAILATYGSLSRGYTLLHDDNRRIRKIGGADDLFWEVIEPDGTLSRYNNVWSGGAFGHRWLLSYRTDRHGNRIDYEWDCPTQSTPSGPVVADCQPLRASYNGVTVTFESEPRRDTILFADGVTSSSAGVYLGLTTRRLSRVVVRVGSAISREYRLTYRDDQTNASSSGSGGSATRRSLLGQVVESGKDDPLAQGPRDLPTRSFTYSGMAPAGFGTGERTGPKEWSYCGDGTTEGSPVYPLVVGDFDGDHCSDFFQGSVSSNLPAVTLSKCDGTAAFEPLVSADIEGGTHWSMADPGLWRFGDFNGDGMTDFAQMWRSGQPTSDEIVYFYLSKGRNAAGQFAGFHVVPSFAVRMDQIWPDYGENDAQRMETGDFNGDGLTDLAIIPHCGGTPTTPCNLPIKIKLARWMEWGVMFDDVDGPIGTFQDTSAANELYAIRRYKYADFNGDGRTDILKIEGFNTSSGSAQAVTIYYSKLETRGYTTTGGFEEWDLSGPKLPYGKSPFDYENGSLHDDTRLKFGDFNGDGLTDIAIVNGSVGSTAQAMSIHLSYGRFGAFSQAIPGPLQKLYNTDQFYSTSWIPMGDFNGDGRTDIGYNTQPGQPLTINLSLGYEASTLTFANTIPGPSTWRLDCGQVADFTGDGRDDLVDLQYYRDARIHRMLGDVPDLMIHSENGIGGSASITYWPSTRFDNSPTSPIQQVVRDIALDDGNGAIATTTVGYKGGAYDAAHHRFLGYAQVTEALPLTDSDQGVRIHRRTTFVQNYQVPPNLEDTVELFRGDPDSGAPLLQRIDYTYRNGNPSSPCLFEAPFSTLLTRIEQRDFDETGIGCPENWVMGTSCAHGRRTMVDREFDLMGTTMCPNAPFSPGWKAGYGNLTKETLHGDPDLTDGRERTVATVFPTTPNNANYVVDKPVSRVVRQGTTGSGALAEQQHFFYDYSLASGNDGSTGWDRAVSVGDLTSTSRWFNRESRWLVSRAEYDAFGNRTATVDELSNRDEVTFDATWHLFPIQHRNAAQHVTLVTQLDAICGRPVRELDANGLETVHTYDAQCRLRRSDLPGGGYKKIDYQVGMTADQRFTWEAVPGANGGDLWSYSYVDALGRVVKSRRRGPSPGQDILTTTTYDARGRAVSSVAPYYANEIPPAPTAMRYDARDRQTRLTLPDQKFRTFDYGYEGGRYRILTTDEESRQRKTFYDGFNDIAETRERKDDGSWIAAQFVSGLDFAETVDPAGNHWTKLLDSLGRVYEERHPDRGTWNFEYYDNGPIFHILDNSNPRKVTEFYYDGIGRKIYKATQVGLPGEAWVAWEYDHAEPGYANVGRIASMFDDWGGETYHWSPAGNLVRKERTIGSLNYAFQYGYDAGNRLKWRTYPDGDTFGTAQSPLQYDDAGRVVSAPGIFSSAAYTAWNAISSFTNGNGVVTARSYDPARYWLTHVSSTRERPSLCTTTTVPRNQCLMDWCGEDQVVCGPGTFQCCQPQSPETIQELTYARDGVGRIRQVGSSFAYEGWSYSYDALGRLTQATSATNAFYNQSWTYDDIGNITFNSSIGSYAYQAPRPGGGVLPHAVSNAGGFGYTYDANGNMTVGRPGTILWNGDGLPIAVGSLRYLYDGNLRRLRKLRLGDSTSTIWYVDGEYEVNQNIATKYFSLGDLLVAKRQAGSTFWLHTDALGSVQAITDAAGSTVWRQPYHPYGEAFLNSSPHKEAHAFTGQRLDESGLLYLSARYYDPLLGRFISADDLVADVRVTSLNAYAYAADDPVNRLDPTGKADEPEKKAPPPPPDKQAESSKSATSSANSSAAKSATVITGEPMVIDRLANGSLLVRFRVPKIDGGGQFSGEFYIDGPKFMAMDGRGADPAPNPSDSRAIATLDFARGIGSVAINPTGIQGTPFLKPALAIGQGNDLFVVNQRNMVSLSGSLTNSVTGLLGSIGFHLSATASGGNVSYQGTRTPFPSFEAVTSSSGMRPTFRDWHQTNLCGLRSPQVPFSGP
jgi:RHS repeat-associated protein